MPWSCFLWLSARPSSSHTDPKRGVASMEIPPGLQDTGGHSLNKRPMVQEPGEARKVNEGKSEVQVILISFLSRQL